MTAADILKIVELRKQKQSYGQISEHVFRSRTRRGDVCKICQVYDVLRTTQPPPEVRVEYRERVVHADRDRWWVSALYAAGGAVFGAAAGMLVLLKFMK